MKKLLPLLLISGCAYIYQPSVVATDEKYAMILEDCRDQAQPGFAESLVYGLNPVAGGAAYGSEEIPTRIDNCLKEHGYEITEE